MHNDDDDDGDDDDDDISQQEQLDDDCDTHYAQPAQISTEGTQSECRSIAATVRGRAHN